MHSKLLLKPECQRQACPVGVSSRDSSAYALNLSFSADDVNSLQRNQDGFGIKEPDVDLYAYAGGDYDFGAMRRCINSAQDPTDELLTEGDFDGPMQFDDLTRMRSSEVRAKCLSSL